MRTVNDIKLSLRLKSPMLLMEFHGSDSGVKEQAEMVQAIAAENGGEPFEWATTPRSARGCGPRATTPTSAAQGRQARLGLWRGLTDACVPISRLAECILESVPEADAAACPTSSSATSATATSTSAI